MLTRDEILQADDIGTEIVDVSEWWGGKVKVKGLSGKERDAFENSFVHRKGKNQTVKPENIRAKLCVLTIVDNEGKRVFRDIDAETLGKKSAAPIDKVFEVASRLSGMSEADVDEMVKNSESNHSDDSTSD